MARKNPERDALLAEVKARQRAAGKKISRLRTVKGIELAATKNDPRRALDKVARYNTPQLRAYLNRLDKFTSRTTQFHADAHGNILSPAAVKEYKAAEAAVNRARKEALKKIGNIKAPGGGGLTIAQRLQVNTPSRPRAVSAANPFTFITRETNQIANEKALRALTKDLQGKLKSDFMGKALKSSRAAAEEILTTMRQPDMVKDVRALSDFHFNILWNATSFAKDIALPYHIARAAHKAGKKSDQWLDDLISENMQNASSLIKDVRKIKPR